MSLDGADINISVVPRQRKMVGTNLRKAADYLQDIGRVLKEGFSEGERGGTPEYKKCRASDDALWLITDLNNLNQSIMTERGVMKPINDSIRSLQQGAVVLGGALNLLQPGMEVLSVPVWATRLKQREDTGSVLRVECTPSPDQWQRQLKHWLSV